MGCGCVSQQVVQSGPPRVFLHGVSEADFVRSLSPLELKDKQLLVAYFRFLHEGHFQVSPQFMDLVRKHGAPPRFRWQVWRALSGWASLPGAYDRASQRPCDPRTVDAIEKDLDRTFPHIEDFDEVKKAQLATMLRAHASLLPDVGYCQGMNFVAGFLLMAADGKYEDAFFMLVQMMVKYKACLLFSDGLPLLKLQMFQFSTLLQRLFPEVHRHFQQNNITPELYVTKWILTAFTQPLPFVAAARIWDLIVCDGLEALVFIALANVKLLKARILRQDTEGILELLSLRGDCEPPSGAAIVKTALSLRGRRRRDGDATLSRLGKLQAEWVCAFPKDAAVLEKAEIELSDLRESELATTLFSEDRLPAQERRSCAGAPRGGGAAPGGNSSTQAASQLQQQQRQQQGQAQSPAARRSTLDDASPHLVATEAQVPSVRSATFTTKPGRSRGRLSTAPTAAAQCAPSSPSTGGAAEQPAPFVLQLRGLTPSGYRRSMTTPSPQASLQLPAVASQAAPDSPPAPLSPELTPPPADDGGTDSPRSSTGPPLAAGPCFDKAMVGRLPWRSFTGFQREGVLKRRPARSGTLPAGWWAPSVPVRLRRRQSEAAELPAISPTSPGMQQTIASRLRVTWPTRSGGGPSQGEPAVGGGSAGPESAGGTPASHTPGTPATSRQSTIDTQGSRGGAGGAAGAGAGGDVRSPECLLPQAASRARTLSPSLEGRRSPRGSLARFVRLGRRGSEAPPVGAGAGAGAGAAEGGKQRSPKPLAAALRSPQQGGLSIREVAQGDAVGSGDAPPTLFQEGLANDNGYPVQHGKRPGYHKFLYCGRPFGSTPPGPADQCGPDGGRQWRPCAL